LYNAPHYTSNTYLQRQSYSDGIPKKVSKHGFPVPFSVVIQAGYSSSIIKWTFPIWLPEVSLFCGMLSSR
jgi:hypothetical protein